MTPFKGYEGLEGALRTLIEDRWGCQLFLARDRVLNPELRENMEAHMDQAHAFLAEVSTGNPSVLYEVGRARGLYPRRTMVLLGHPRTDSGKVELPADLQGLLYLQYTHGAPVEELADHLERELRKLEALGNLLDDEKRERYVSARILKQFVRKLKLDDSVFVRLADRFPTRDRWLKLSEKELAAALKDIGEDAEITALLSGQRRKGLEG